MTQQLELWNVECFCSGKGYDNNGCGKKVQISQEDIHINSYHFLNGDRYNCYDFICPDCGARTSLLEKVN